MDIRKWLLGFYMLVLFGMLQGYAQNALSDKDLEDLIALKTNQIYEDPESCIEFGLEVYQDEANKINIRIKALALVSSAYSSKRDYQKALEYISMANELMEQVNDPLLAIEILSRTGILYQQMSIYDKSIEFLDKTEKACLAYPVRDSVRTFLAKTYIVKGFIYRENLSCDIALNFFDKGIKEYEAKGLFYETNLSIAYYNKGNCYTTLSQYEEAKESYRRSITLASAKGANSLVSFAQKGLAEVYLREGRYQEAIDLLQNALNQSKDVGDLVLNQGIYQGLFENYLALDDWEQYQVYYNHFLATKDEIELSERNSISDAIQENDRLKDAQIDAIQSHFSFNVKAILVTGFLLLVVIVFMEIKQKSRIKALKKQVEKLQQRKS
ncbi:tetratricopeptide repeat protein [Mangrovimonas xylaniphaga]|uniref:tetratricopeptide repeat protein n=1 Tax=Mangrovimonas xylaniphaga TaxID=1645915 RepID=UPI0009E996DE|nr:tetratricopeptide repeat protein [Mangrovimonas xylaniphaga]